MKILLTGAGGRFGQAFRAAATNHEVVDARKASAAFDLEHPGSMAPAVRASRPDWVVHAAALSDVDACEREPARAHRMNAESTGELAEASAAVGSRFLYVSTDYVFDGTKGDYAEDNQTGPLSVYGASKLEGEKLALAACPDAVIARTSVVFGTPSRPDFVSWVVGQLHAGQPFRLVKQRASPTSTPDLAAQALALVEHDRRGIYHTAGAEALSRLAMVETVADLMGLEARIEEVPMDQMTWLAKRPVDSSLNIQKVARLARPMQFRDAASRYLEALR